MGQQADAASSVADEAARLAQAFAAWAGTPSRPSFADADATSSQPATAADHTERPECSCAHGSIGETVCRMCPVCRAAGLLQAIQPDLLDRVADLLSLAADGLHAAAEQRRRPDRDGGDVPEGGDK